MNGQASLLKLAVFLHSINVSYMAVVVNFNTDQDRRATYLAVFRVLLLRNRAVDQQSDSFTTKRAGYLMFFHLFSPGQPPEYFTVEAVCFLQQWESLVRWSLQRILHRRA